MVLRGRHTAERGSVAPSLQHAASAQYDVIDLGVFTPVAINRRREIAGQVTIGGSQHTAVWSGGVLRDLGTLPPKDGARPGYAAVVTGINRRGQIVGYESFDWPFEDVRAFLWEDGVLRDIGRSARWVGITARRR